MENPLNGIFRVSFDIEVNSSDQVSLSDISQALSEGLGEGLLERVSHLSVEKIEKHGKIEPKILKIGDRVQLKRDTTLNTEIYHDDGYIFIGNPTYISEKMTTEKVNVKIEAGSIGYINKIHKDGSIEVVDLDKPIINPLWKEIGIDAVNVDLVALDAELIEKLNLEGGE